MNTLSGVGPLIRLILRRDRIVLPLWVLFLAAFPLINAVGFSGLYPTAEQRQAFANGIASNPAEIALIGPLFSSTLGGLVAWRISASGPLLLGLASLFTVIRHTRTEEEAGRRELLGATVVGRQAPLAAVLIVLLGAYVVLGILAALELIAFGLPVSGAWAIGASFAAAGCVWAAIAAIAAQLTEGAGAARGIAGAVLGIFYLLRAMGGASGTGSRLAWLAWLSPFSWFAQIRPFASERWWLFAPILGVTIILVAIAFALSARRDLGAGIFPPRLGPATAAPGLRSPLALAWRLQRGTLLAWIIGSVVVGTIFGNIAQTVTDQLRASPQMMALFTRIAGNAGPSDAFFTLALAILGEVAAVYAILAALRLPTEEESMRADPVLVTPVSRWQWAAGHLVVTLIGTAAVLAAFGVSAGFFYGLSSGNLSREVPRVLAATLAYLPAIWIFAAITVALWGVWPRFARLSWVAFIVCLLIDLAGEFQQGNQTMLDFSPFTHVPKLLVSQASFIPFIWLLAIAAVLLAGGLVRFQQRDIG